MNYFRFLVPTLVSGFLAVSSVLAGDPVSMTVSVANPSGLARPSETVEVPWSEILLRIPGALPDHLLVKDATGNSLPSQVLNFHPENRKGLFDSFLFQYDFASGEKSASFTIEATTEPVPPFPSKVFARYVPERFDDFAWENDRIAHRIYGQALETPSAGKSMMTGSGIDVWSKRVRYLIVDRWYLKSHDNYHKDTGDGLDMYDTGKWRGCGGTGIWSNGNLFVSHNWKSWKVMANGPIRAVFELTYEPWDGGGVQVSETKRFTVDAGHNLDLIESTFLFNGKPEVTVGIGLGKHPKGPGELTQNKEQGWMSLWEKYKEDGQLGTAVVLAPGEQGSFTEDQHDYLLLTQATPSKAVRYYAGAGWDRSGDFSSKEDWNATVASLAARLASPVTLSYSPPPAGAASSADLSAPPSTH